MLSSLIPWLPPRVRVVAMAWLAASVGVLPALANEQPNIVLILVDDIGQECLSSYGSADYETPHLDRLAAEGLRFTQAHSQPLCTPTRVQIMTGQYNVRNYTQFGELRRGERTFGHDLREAGYATAIAGKWQLGKNRALINEFGFDEYCLWWLEYKSWRYLNAGDLIINGEVRPGGQGDYGPDVINDFVLDFISRKAEADTPFLVYYPMMLPHAPFVPTPLSADRTDPRKQDTAYYRDMVAYMDGLVGRVVDHLDKIGERENTLVIFLGDNGTNHDITSRMQDGSLVRGGKGDTTNAGTHVPMVVSWPAAVPAGLVAEGLVDFSDIVPTLRAAAGMTADPDRPLDGHDLLPVFRGEGPTPREWSYCWYGVGRDGVLETTDLEVTVFARTVRYKLYRDGRFYDVLRDVTESAPLDVALLSSEARQAHKTLKGVIAHYDNVEAQR